MCQPPFAASTAPIHPLLSVLLASPQLRVAQVTGGAASKLGKIKQTRKNIARVLTVINTKAMDAYRSEVKGEKSNSIPKALRPKKTRALRRALTPKEVRLARREGCVGGGEGQINALARGIQGGYGAGCWFIHCSLRPTIPPLPVAAE